MDVRETKMLIQASREELLNQYKEVKENTYFRIFLLPILIVFYVAAKKYLPETEISEFIVYFVFIVFFINLGRADRLEKKVNILYEIEKTREREVQSHGEDRKNE